LRRVDLLPVEPAKDGTHMSATASSLTIACLAQGKIRVKTSDAPPRTLESAYGNSLREEAVRAQQKHSWKAQGDNGSPFSGAVLWGKAAIQNDVPLAITSICAGLDAGGMVYSLESGSLCALLQVSQVGAEERRVWNTPPACHGFAQHRRHGVQCAA
jgi:hypothetical protein